MFAAFFEEQVQEVLTLKQSVLFLLACELLRRQRWHVQSRVPQDQCLAEVVEGAEAALALDITQGIAAGNRIEMVVLNHLLLDEHCYAYFQLDVSVVAWDMDAS